MGPTAGGKPARIRRLPLVSRWAVLLVLCPLFMPGGAVAQMMHLDAIPWFTEADSTSRLALEVEINRFHDPKYDWNLNRLLLTVILPAGDDATFFLRLPHMTFDTSATSVSQRWPWVLGEETPRDWPYEQRTSSFGQIEAGVTGPARLPVVGWVSYALALGIPMGSDRVYPFSSTSIPLRVELKKTLPLGGRTHLGFVAGYLSNMDSGKDDLSPAAFPSGVHLGAALDFFRGRGSRLGLTYDYQDRESRRSQLAGAQWWLPWGEDGSVGFKVAAEMQGTLDRPAAWYFTLAFRLDSARYRKVTVPPAP